MKRIALLVLLAFMVAPAFNKITNAAEQPVYTLSVEKSNGGFFALFNLYGNVSYNEHYDPEKMTIDAQLRCTGRGFSPCRVPEDAGTIALPTNNLVLPGILPANAQTSFANEINAMIEESENKFEAGIYDGSKTKKVLLPQNNLNTSAARNNGSVSRNNVNSRPLIVYTSNWKYDSKGDGKMKINVYKMDSSLIGF